MSTEPSEAELRAALEEQMRNLRVDDVLIQTAVTLVNLAGRRLGLAPGGEGERDLGQVRDAIDAVRGLLPVLDRAGEGPIAPLRDALSQLQVEYAKLAGGAPAAEETGEHPEPEPESPKPGEPGPAQASGRLWVPGQ